jgi:hypothetical protein
MSNLMNTYKEFSIEALIFLIIYLIKCVLFGNFLLCLTKYNHSNLMSSWVDFIKYIDSQFAANIPFNPEKPTIPSYNLMVEKDRFEKSNKMKKEYFSGDKLNLNSKEFDKIRNLVEYGSTNEVEFDTIIDKNIKKYNLIFFRLDPQYIYTYLNYIFTVYESSNNTILLYLFIYKLKMYTLEFFYNFFNILYNFPEWILLLMCLMPSAIIVSFGYTILTIASLVICIRFIFDYSDFLFGPILRYFNKKLMAVWNFYMKKIYDKTMNNGSDSDDEEDHEDHEDYDTEMKGGGHGHHSSHSKSKHKGKGKHKGKKGLPGFPGSGAAGIFASIAQGLENMPKAFINSVLNVILFVLGSIVVFIIFIVIISVEIIILVILFAIILFISLVLGTFILLYQIVLLIFIFYPKITGIFVTTREALRDKHDVIVPDQYMFQGTQKFNMLICFYLTFLNKTVLYYAYYVMFYMIPLTIKFFGSLSLMVTLIVAVIVGYQIGKVKNAIKNKVYGFGQSDEKDALIISAVAQEIDKRTETSNI